MKRKTFLFFCLTLLFSLILLAGCNKARTTSSYSPPGKLYDLGGYKLHLQSQGSGSPTVIMEAGAGDCSLTWTLVAPVIARTNRVCTYDRGGMGWSDVSPYPRLATIEVAELHALLQKAGIKPPYVLVGHSLGGVLARVFTHTYSNEVVSLVLVDPSHEEQMTRQEPAIQKSMSQATDRAQVMLRGLADKAARGKLTNADVNAIISPNLPTKEKAEYAFLLRTRSVFWQTVIAELKSLDASFAGVKAEHITSLGNIPLIVISSSATPEIAGTQALSLKAVRVLRKLQQELSEESTRGVHITAKGTTHFIQLVQPQTVINAIKRVLQ